MYPINSTARALFEAEQRQKLRITGADASSHAIAITEADVIEGTFQIDRFSSNGKKIEIGTAISSELTFKLRNTDGTFDDIQFEGAELFVEIGVRDWTVAGSTTYWIPCGYFTVDEVKRQRFMITLSALDRMVWFDRTVPITVTWTDNFNHPITDNNGNQITFDYQLTFPTTVAGLITQVCAVCGITLATNVNTLPNASYSIPSAPEKSDTETFTARSYLQWLAALTGTCAYMDWNGQLRLQWYAAADYSCTADRRFDSTMYEKDIIITGLKYVKSGDKSAMMTQVGTDQYMIDLSDNRLIQQSTARTALTAIFDQIGWYMYRPFNAKVISAPYLFPLDQITFVDADGVSHDAVLTNVNVGLNSTTQIEGKGETEKNNSYATWGRGVTAEQARAMAIAAQNARDGLIALDNSLTQQELFDRLTDGGLEQGLALESPVSSLGAAGEKKLYLNVDYARYGELGADRIAAGAITADKIAAGAITADLITTGTMSANRIQGGMLTLGGLNNADGTLQIIDESGNVIGTWDKDGALINSGSVTSYSADRLARVLLSVGELVFQRWGIDSGTGQYAWIDKCSIDVSESSGTHTTEISGNSALEQHFGGSINIHNTSMSGTATNYGKLFFDTSKAELSFGLTNRASVKLETNSKVTITGNLTVSGTLAPTGGIVGGATGTFTTANGKTVTVSNGIITSIS